MTADREALDQYGYNRTFCPAPADGESGQ
jgi:hypothetical protein